MTFANADSDAESPEIFAAVLTPQRSLSLRGFRIVLVVLAILSLGVGTLFFLLGAWPVPAFLGIAVLAVYVAFRFSYRAGRAAEEISLTRKRLTIRRVAPNGRASATALNPYWARLEIDRREPFGITGMAISSHGEKVAIGGFLGPGERETLATALAAALAKVRSGAAP
jgi:uncharacterized membrane protein